MEAFVTLDAWSAGARLVIVLAQLASNARGDAETTAAHLASVLAEMGFARRLLADGMPLPDLDKAIGRALLVARKSSAKQSVLSPELVKLATTDRALTAPALLRALSGGDLRAEVLSAIHARADEIGAPLDDPRVGQTMQAPLAAENAPLNVGFRLASKLKHADVTTRHVVTGMMNAYALTKNEKFLEFAEEAAAIAERLQSTLDRTTPRREGATVVWSPRLVGAICAGHAAVGKELFFGTCFRECFEGDPDTAAARDLMNRIVAKGATRIE